MPFIQIIAPEGKLNRQDRDKPGGSLSPTTRKSLAEENEPLVDGVIGPIDGRLNHRGMLTELDEGGWTRAGQVFTLAGIQAAKNIRVPQMKNHIRSLLLTMVAVTLTNLTHVAPASAESSQDLLSVDFQSRNVVKVEAGFFTFGNSRFSPIHTHVAPAIGYVVKGTILYQVEGEEPRLLRGGDAFYEPVGKRILRFDNASATEGGNFVDFNLLTEDAPYVVLEEPSSQPAYRRGAFTTVDRQTLSTVRLDDVTVDGADIKTHTIDPDANMQLEGASRPTFGYVAEGTVILRIEGKAAQRFVEHESFYRASDISGAILANASSNLPAKVITFTLNTP